MVFVVNCHIQRRVSDVIVWSCCGLLHECDEGDGMKCTKNRAIFVAVLDRITLNL